MRRKTLALSVVLTALMLALSGCGQTVATQTTTVQITGPASTLTQTVTLPGPTITRTITISGMPYAVTYPPTTSAAQNTPTQTASQTGSVTPFQGITKILSITPPSPASLHIYEKITVTFEYVITDPAGGRIRAIGYNVSCGLYSYNGSDIIPAGKGTLSRSFFVSTALTSPVIIDQIYVQMCDSAMTTVFEVFLPVDYKYIP